MNTNQQLVELATPGVQGLKPYAPGKPVEELERELGIENAVKLASNENPLGPSPLALAAAREAMGNIARYPDGNAFRLKLALADKLSVDSEQITPGNGSNDVLEVIARTFAGPGDEIIFSEYGFAVYPIAAQAVGARAVVTPAINWAHDLEAMAAAVTENTKVIFIANPNNPTGTWLKAEEIEAFLAKVPDRVMVVLDEAYHEYMNQPDYRSALAWLDEHPNLIVTRTFSKAYGLAGLRVGYAVSHKQVANLLNRVRQPFNVNLVALAAAEAALADEAFLRRAVEVNAQGMAQICQVLDDRGIDYIPSVGNFLCVRVGEGDAVYQKLLHQGVIVRPVSNYGMSEYLRVSIGVAEENDRFLEALFGVLA